MKIKRCYPNNKLGDFSHNVLYYLQPHSFVLTSSIDFNIQKKLEVKLFIFLRDLISISRDSIRIIL